MALSPMILGWALSLPDNDSYMLGAETENVVDPVLRKIHTWRFMLNGSPHPATCGRCGRKTDPEYVNPGFRVKKRRHALSTTYDGYVIASRVFQALCKPRRYPGLEFIALPADDEFAVMRVHNVVPFDAIARGTRLESLCPRCGCHAVVAGAHPVFLKGIKSPLEDGFYRTDLEFACSHEQSPIVLVGASTAEFLRSQELRGIVLEKIVAQG